MRYIHFCKKGLESTFPHCFNVDSSINRINFIYMYIQPVLQILNLYYETHWKDINLQSKFGLQRGVIPRLNVILKNTPVLLFVSLFVLFVCLLFWGGGGCLAREYFAHTCMKISPSSVEGLYARPLRPLSRERCLSCRAPRPSHAKCNTSSF